MIGKYLIYQDSKLVGEYRNILTTEGKSLIRNYLAGNIGAWSGSIAIGAMNSTAPSVSDSGLEFEIIRVPVVLSTVKGNNIILSADLDSTIAGRIFELGVYPTVTNSFSAGFDDKIIANFSEDWTDDLGVSLTSSNFNGTEELPIARVGYRNLIVGSSGIDTLYSIGLDLSGYSDLDSMSMLYKVTSTGSNRTLRLTFYDNQLPTPGTKYYDFTLSGSSAGYKTLSAQFGLFTETGDFNNNVSKVGISSSGNAAPVELDAIKLDDSDETNPNFALVSRALIGSAGGNSSTDYFEKRAGTTMTIEYVVELT
jgi:hypothetical protein